MRGPLLAGGSSANSEIITPSIPSRLWRNENERRSSRGEEGEEEGMHEMKGRGESSKARDEKGEVGPPGRTDGHSCIRRDIIIKDHGYTCSLNANGWVGLNAGQGAGRMDYELW